MTNTLELIAETYSNKDVVKSAIQNDESGRTDEKYVCGFCNSVIVGEGFISPIGAHYCNVSHWADYCD